MPQVRQNCKCGTCSTCVDLAKWETTFEKNHGAAARAYYSGARLHASTTCNGLIEMEQVGVVGGASRRVGTRRGL